MLKVDKESYIRHLDSVIANGAKAPKNRSMARCEKVYLVEEALTEIKQSLFVK